MTMPSSSRSFGAWGAPSLRAQAGVGLVEIMVSVTIGLVIVGALVALFVGTSRNNREMASANNMIENGRFAIELLEEDVVHAGYLGQFVPAFDDQTSSAVPTDVPTAVPDPCTAYGTWSANYVNDILGIPLQVYETPAICTAIVTNQLANTDVLVVRHTDTCFAGETGCEADTTDKLYVQASQCNTENATPYRLGLTGTTVFDRHKRDCTTLAEKRRFVSNLYFVRNYAVTAGDGIPTLMRATFDSPAVGSPPAFQAAIPLIEGIDGLSVEIGVDDLSVTGGSVDYNAAVDWEDPDYRTRATNRGDGIPDGAYVRCTNLSPCTVDQLMNATSVRIYVLARSREPTRGYVDTKTYTLGSGPVLGPFDDAYKRHVYSTTVRLPNISGRRLHP
jgi:type IV pilus assembly protein PilW